MTSWRISRSAIGCGSPATSTRVHRKTHARAVQKLTELVGGHQRFVVVAAAHRPVRGCRVRHGPGAGGARGVSGVVVGRSTARVRPVRAGRRRAQGGRRRERRDVLLGRPVRRSRASRRRLHRAPDQGGRGRRSSSRTWARRPCRITACGSSPGQRLTQSASDGFLGWSEGPVDRPPLLRPAAVGQEGLGGSGAHGPARADALRRALRVGPRARARANRRPGHASRPISGSAGRSTTPSRTSRPTYADQAERDHAAAARGDRQRAVARRG